MKRLVFVLLLFSSSVGAQRLTFTQLTDANGLPSSEVYQLIQDRKGFIWIATDAGVARYDGERLDVFNKSTGLPDPVVFGFYENENDMWLRSFSGALASIAGSTVSGYSYNDILEPMLRKVIVNSIKKDSLGNLWLGTTLNGKLIRCKGADCLAFDIPANTIFVKQIESDFVNGYSGPSTDLHTIHINGLSFPVHLAAANQSYANLSVVRWNSKIYIAINHNIFEFDGRQLTPFKETAHPIISLSTDRSGKLWVGYLTGGTEYFTADSREAQSFPFFSGKSVTTVLQDHQGGYWFSTLENGVFHFPSLEIKLYSYPWQSKISAAIGYRGYAYTGDYNGRVIRYSNQTQPEIVAQLPGAVMAIAPQNDGLWISTVASLYWLNLHSLTPELVDASNSIRDICVHRDSVWAVSHTGIFEFVKKKLVRHKEVDFWPRMIAKDNGRIVVGTTVNALEINTTLAHFTPIAQLEKFKLQKLLFWKDWLLTGTIGNGLVLTKGAESRVLDVAHGFVANNIYTMLVDQDQLFLGTEEGIVDLHLPSIEATAFSVDYRIVNQLHGLPFNKNNFIAKTDDMCWSFYESGYTVISLKALQDKNPMPHVFLRNMEVNNQPWKASDELRFNENNLKFEIGLVSFTNRNVFFRHRIANDQDWAYTKAKEIEYFSVAPGNHRAQIEYSTDQRQWKELLNRSFTIVPPWWHHWYFWSGVGILGGTLIFLSVSNRIKNLRLKESSYRQFIAGVEHERTRLGGELHDNIGSRLSQLKRSDIAQDVADELDHIIYEVRALSHELSPPITHVEGILPLVEVLISRTREKSGIDINLQVFDFVENFSASQIIQLFRIFQEALHNITRHSNAQAADIQFFGYPERIVITIDDDGIGFEPNLQQQGLGLTQLKLRAMVLNAKIEINSSAGHGTHIVLEIPIA